MCVCFGGRTFLFYGWGLEMKENDVTILVNSCDKYEDAWEPFFRLLKIQWPDCPYEIVLSTETKTYECDFFNVKTINCDKNLSWSSRLKYTLNQIDTEFVLFFLEDFFLLEPVQTDILNVALAKLKAINNICVFEFPSVEPNYHKSSNSNNKKCFCLVDRYKPYRTKVMISLWRKSDFQKLLFENENPWQCEKETSIRSMAYNKKVFKQEYHYSIPAFYYHINPKCGFGITGGKWLNKNKQFFESMGINTVNYKRLGVMETPETYKQLEEKRKKKELTNYRNILRTRNLIGIIKEFTYISIKKVKRLFKVDLIVKIMKYRKYYKNQL